MILALGMHAPGGAAEGPYPGLPDINLSAGSWFGAAQGGISEAAKARQWAQVPMQTAAVYSVTRTITYPQPDPLDRKGGDEMTIFTYFVSPAGSEHNYGLSPRFTVRTVAFGAIPVEATLQLIQRRNADGEPVPIVVSAKKDIYNTGPLFPGGPDRPLREIQRDTVVEDDVTLRVARLRVDGIDLGLSGRCQTSAPGKLSLLGKGWDAQDGSVNQAQPWLTGNYAPAAGGLMVGTVDVPAFAGCTASGGEDISRLLTSAVSGPGNTVRLNVSSPSCNRPRPVTSLPGPPRPGETTTEAAGCQADQLPPLIPIP